MYGVPEQAGLRIDIIIDSGAYRSVIPPSIAPAVPLLEANMDQTRPGRTAGGEELPVLGRKQLRCSFLCGQPKNMEFLVMGVTRPLGSVSQMVEKGCRIIFDAEDSGGSWLEHKPTGDRHRIFLRGGVFVLPAWIQVPDPAPTAAQASGFPRPAAEL